jgi:DNA invertase Pin-like site-specific DNA recombinase
MIGPAVSNKINTIWHLSDVSQKGFDAQIEELNRIGCEKIFKEQVSSIARREVLDKAISSARESDVVVVTKLDRLAHSISHLWKLVDKLEDKVCGAFVYQIFQAM